MLPGISLWDDDGVTELLHAAKTCASLWDSTPGHSEMIHAHSRYSSQAKITTDKERRFFRNALS